MFYKIKKIIISSRNSLANLVTKYRLKMYNVTKQTLFIFSIMWFVLHIREKK